jgi:hypothetical protein
VKYENIVSGSGASHSGTALLTGAFLSLLEEPSALPDELVEAGKTPKPPLFEIILLSLGICSAGGFSAFRLLRGRGLL